MKVFLSWSGETSRQVALVLRDWLPNVLQNIEPWMSSEDLEKGARWALEIAKELATTKAGIVCVTSDNLEAPWLNFESGALSKTVQKDMVCTYLFGLKPSDVIGPLAQFQASVSIKEDTQRLLNTLNKALSPNSLPEGKLSEAFEMWWPKLEKKLGAISSVLPSGKVTRSDKEMIEELLNLARNQDRAIEGIVTVLGSLHQDYGTTYPNIIVDSSSGYAINANRRGMLGHARGFATSAPVGIGAIGASLLTRAPEDDETDSESDSEPESTPETH